MALQKLPTQKNALDCEVMIVGGGPAGISTWLHLQKYAPQLASHTVVIDKGGDVARRYGVVGIPTAILLDKGGNVRYRGHGVPDNIEDVL